MVNRVARPTGGRLCCGAGTRPVESQPLAICECCNKSFRAVHRIAFRGIMCSMKVLHAAVGVVVLLAAVAASDPSFAGGSRVRVGVVVGAPVWGPAWGWRAGWGPGWGPGWGAGWGPGWGPGWGAGWGPGWGGWGPGWGPAPVVVGVPSSPVFIERSDVAPAPVPQQPSPSPPPPPQQQQQQSHYWYYCPDSRAYYPYVRECAGGWERVAPQPPS